MRIQKTPKTDDYYVQDLYLADVEEGGSHKVCRRHERQELLNVHVPVGQPLGRVVNRRKQQNLKVIDCVTIVRSDAGTQYASINPNTAITT